MKMSFERSYREHLNFSKRIPLHYKKRYLANISNGSFNATVLTAIYKNKIKTLLKNNKLLALALENDRIKKEELMAESKANADLIMFSKLKLASMSENLKKAVSVLDETLSLLEMHSSASISKFTPRHTICREEFKEQLKEVSMAGSIAEENESFDPNQSKENVKNRSLRLSAISESPAEATVPANRCSHPKVNTKKSEKRGQPTLKKSKNKSVIKASNLINSSNDLILSPVKEIAIGTTFGESKKSSNNKKSLQKTNSSQIIKNSKTKKVHIKSRCASKTACKPSITSLRKNKMIKIPFDPKSDLTEKCISSEKICNINETTVNNDNLSINFPQKISCKTIQRKQNNRKNRKSMILTNANVEFDELCFSSTEPTNNICGVSNVVKCSLGAVRKIVKNDSNEKLVLFNSEKKNEVGKLQDLIMKKISSYHASELKLSTPQRRKGRKSVENLSTIADLKHKKTKRKSACQLDDITAVNVTENDICHSVIKKNNSSHNLISGTESLVAVKKVYNRNRQSLSDMDNLLGKPCSEEIVHQNEKMGGNALLVTTEIHQLPNLLVSEKTLPPENNECFRLMQPIVLVEDIFKGNKSYCKSISQPSPDEQNSIPLKEPLLDHCSALKQIPDESAEAQNKNSTNADSDLKISVEEDKNAGHFEAATAVMEPPLSEENKFIEECSDVDNRKLRRRSSICYREHPTNVKLRR